MGKVITYEVELNGIRGAITDGDALAAAVRKTNEEFKKADFGSQKYKELGSQLGALKKIQADQRAEVRKQGREYEIAADKGQRSYRAINAELVNARAAFKELSQAQRESDQVGGVLIKQIQALDKELKDIDKTIGLNQRNVGNYPDLFAQLSGIDLGSLLTIPGAILAGGEAAIQATQFIKGLTDEFRALRGEVQSVTGTTGDELDMITERVAAISDTFGQPVEEILQASNALTQNLTGSFDESLRLIEEGLVGGLDANGQFLDQLREYPTFFDEAGLSGDQFLGVIQRQIQEGIFSDKGIDAIKEATLSLRELPKSAVDALAGIGISSEEIRKAIDEDGVGGAIQLVSKRLGEFEDDSIEVGTVIADVFKGAGEDAGVSFIKSLGEISDSTDGLIDKSNEYQQQQLETLRVNQEFAAVQNEVAQALGGASSSFDNLGTIIQTKALQALLFIIDGFRESLAILDPVREAVVNFLQVLGFLDEQGQATERTMSALNFVLDGGRLVLNILATVISTVTNQLGFFIGKIVEGLEYLGILDKDSRTTAESVARSGDAAEEAATKQEKQAEATKKQTDEVKKASKSFKEYEDRVKKAGVATDKIAKDSIAALRKEVQDLKKEFDESSLDEGLFTKLIKAEEALELAEETRKKLRRQIIGGGDGELLGEISVLPTIVPGPLAEVAETEDEFDKAYNESRKARAQETKEFLVELEKERAEETVLIAQELLGQVGGAIDALSTFSEARYENELSALENRYDREIQRAEGNEALQEQLAEELDAKKEQLQREEFNRQKRFRTSAALTSLAEGIINILSAPSTIPDPFGTIFKTVRIGVLTATTAAQIAKINAQKAAKGTLVQEQYRSDSLGLSQFGVVRGSTHGDRSGGELLNILGRPVLAEHGERIQRDEFGGVAVINKRSSSAFDGLLSRMQGSIFPGKRALLSGINSYKSYGVKFAQDGALIRPDLESLQPGPGGGGVTTIVKVELNDEQIATLAAANGAAVEKGSMNGTALGLESANRQAERQARLDERAGLT